MHPIRTFFSCVSLTLLLSFVGCSGTSDTTDHGELPKGAVIEVRFDEPSTNLLALEVLGTQYVTNGNEESWNSNSHYGYKKVNSGKAWTYEIDEDRDGISASFKAPGDVGFTVQLKDGDKVVKTVKSDDSRTATLLAGTVRNESSVDAIDMRIDSEESEYLSKLLTEWLAGDDIRSYLDDSFAGDEDLVNRLIKGGSAVKETFSPDIAEALNRFAAWDPESTDDGPVLAMWGALVRQDGEELFVEFGRDEDGKLITFKVDGPLVEKLKISE